MARTMPDVIGVVLEGKTQRVLLDGEDLPFEYRVLDTTVEGWPTVTIEIPCRSLQVVHSLRSRES